MSTDVVSASVDVTAMTASVTQAAFMAPANSPGSATVRRAGAASSAIRVSLQRVWILCSRDPYL